MARYFYKDWMRAIWMQKNHGIQYLPGGLITGDSNFAINVYVGNPTFSDKVRIYAPEIPGLKFYIHPDCHELLKPQFGDKGIYVSSYFEFTGFYNGWQWQNEECMEIECQDIEIIRRNGKAFFASEVEGD